MKAGKQRPIQDTSKAELNQLKERLAIVHAVVGGSPVERRSKADVKAGWEKVKSAAEIVWDWDHYSYRTFDRNRDMRPWAKEEVPVGSVIINHNNKARGTIYLTNTAT